MLKPLLLCKTQWREGASKQEQAECFFAAIEEFEKLKQTKVIAWTYEGDHPWNNGPPYPDTQGYVVFILANDEKYWCVRWNKFIAITYPGDKNDPQDPQPVKRESRRVFSKSGSLRSQNAFRV